MERVLRAPRASLFWLVCAAIVSAPVAGQETARWYIGTYTNDLLVWDDASERVVDRIRMRHPIPMNVFVSDDRDRLYVREASAQIIEVVDLEAGEVVDELTLSHDSITVRINAFAPHPSNRKAAMEVTTYTKHRDRYSVEGPYLVEYDFETKQITDTIPHPDGPYSSNNSPYRSPFGYAPDGETFYFFDDDIIATDAETYEELDRWPLSSRPLQPGLGRAGFGTSSGTWDEPGVSTSLFRMTDPAQNRRMMGVSRVRLSEREVDFFTLGTSEPVGDFAIAPGGDVAYALYDEIGRYEFWEFDLRTERVSRRQPFAGRPRMGLEVSADGERLFVHVAGNTIDVYDADTFELLRTVELEEDMTGVAVIPGPGPGR